MVGSRQAAHRRGAVYWEMPIVCLAAHMALVLARAGLADHPVTRGALAFCRHRFDPGNGFGCFAVGESLLPACVMAVPKVLKALLAVPTAHRTVEDAALVDALVALLRAFGLYAYVPRDARAWRAWVATVGPAERRAAKADWIAAGRVEPRQAKEGWRRFSFPHSYNSDLLEVLLLLGEAGQPSPWITYRALLALRRFGAVALPA